MPSFPGKFALSFVVACQIVAATAGESKAQVVTTFVPATPMVSFVPEQRGLFGRRTVFRPVVSFPAAVPVGTVVTASPVTVARPVVVASPVTTWHPIAPVQWTTVASPIVVSEPVTAWRPVSAPRTFTAASPVVVAPPVTTTFFAPTTPVTTFWTPAFP